MVNAKRLDVHLIFLVECIRELLELLNGNSSLLQSCEKYECKRCYPYLTIKNSFNACDVTM